MPNESLWKQKRPNREMTMVSSADSGAWMNCHKPELASSLEKIVAPDKCPRISSAAGRGCLLHWSLILSLVKSMQM